MLLTNKFWGFAFVIGVFVLFIFLYAFFSTTNDKTEASTSQESVNGESVVVVDDRGFRPQVTKITVGTPVKWVNKGGSEHRVTFGVNASLENLNHIDQVLKPSEALTYKFERMGNFNFYDKSSGFSGVVEVK